MHAATKSYQKQILVWLLWAIAIFIFVSPPEPMSDAPVGELPVLAGAIAHQRRDGPLFVWRYRLRVFIGRHGGVLRRISRRVAWAARWANWARSGALTMARVVDWLTRAQLRRQLGALPVLYALLEVLQVRDIINRHCPTAADVDHGTVALVLILNRLVAPRPLYQVADWLSRTLLVHTLGIPADKFNDDRLGRTLDALSQHGREIWQDIVHRALVQTDIDLSVIFYDLTAFVVHGEYTASEYVDFGFAHNTPMDKRKFKVGLNAAADGSIPTLYQLWSGRTTDVATVQENMDRLSRLLAHYGRPVDEVLIIGDRANLNDKLAIVYQEKGLRYLAGLQARKTVHRELLVAYSEQQLRSYPLNTARGAAGYWGRSCPVTFEHQGQQVIHQGLVVLSGPMRSAVRKSRATKLRALHQKLREVQAKIGRSRYRSVACVQQRANTVLKGSAVGKFMQATAYLDDREQVSLRWEIDRATLLSAMQQDGRYLLATNDTSLSPQRMFELYLAKDGVEKCFRVAKSDLQVSPIYVHKDSRIEGMLLTNMLALLTYSVLQRQVRKAGWQITTRQIIAKLANLDVIETLCWDGSVTYRMVPMDKHQAGLLEVLAQVLADLRHPHRHHPRLPSGNTLPLALPPPSISRARAAPALAA